MRVQIGTRKHPIVFACTSPRGRRCLFALGCADGEEGAAIQVPDEARLPRRGREVEPPSVATNTSRARYLSCSKSSGQCGRHARAEDRRACLAKATAPPSAESCPSSALIHPTSTHLPRSIEPETSPHLSVGAPHSADRLTGPPGRLLLSAARHCARLALILSGGLPNVTIIVAAKRQRWDWVNGGLPRHDR